MTDWSKSMTQTFEYYTVNSNTWEDVDLLTNVKSATISRDSTAETLGSANFDIDDDIGECYIRAYLKVEKECYFNKRGIYRCSWKGRVMSI